MNLKPNHFVNDSLGDPSTCIEDHNHSEPEVEQTELNRMAQLGYEAYAESRGWNAYDGTAIPTWDAVREEIQTAWEVAAQAIMEASA